jgi:hypothetical protein
MTYICLILLWTNLIVTDVSVVCLLMLIAFCDIKIRCPNYRHLLLVFGNYGSLKPPMDLGFVTEVSLFLGNAVENSLCSSLTTWTLTVLTV